FQEGSVFHRFGVPFQIPLQHLLNVEIIGKLEVQGGIVDILELYLFDVLPERQFRGVLFAVRNSPAGHNGAQVQPFAKFLPGVVKPSAQPQPPVIGMNEDVNAIKDITVGIVCIRSEEHTSELQSRENLVCRLLLEKKK